MQGNSIHITWYGTAAVRITAGSSQLLIDPFFPLPDSRIKLPEDSFDGCKDIIITHGHFDHIGSLRDIVRPEHRIYCTEAPCRSLCKKGVSKENICLIRMGDVLNIGDFRVTAYKGSHIKLSVWDGLKAIFCKRVWNNRRGVIRKILKFTSCREKKESLCYLVEVCGKRILIMGSLAIAEGTDYPKAVDLALFPYQGSEQIFDIAKGIYEKLLPKAVMLTHFDDTFPPFSTEVDTAEFEDYLKKRVKVYKLGQGGSIEI
jgi:L-ascorbate metabolism protein UlaG (beta-lactamase superfamily)